MPLSKRWSRYSAATLPNQVGVYELAYNKSVVYIGSGDVARRIAKHDQRDYSFNHFRYEITNSRKRARQRERAEQRAFKKNNGRLPKYNDQIG